MPDRPPVLGAGSAPVAALPAIRVVLADDSVLFREGLARVLTENGFLVVGQAGDAEALHEMVARDDPDVVVTDIRMPPTNSNDGLLAAQRIREVIGDSAHVLRPSAGRWQLARQRRAPPRLRIVGAEFVRLARPRLAPRGP